MLHVDQVGKQETGPDNRNSKPGERKKNPGRLLGINWYSLSSNGLVETSESGQSI